MAEEGGVGLGGGCPAVAGFAGGMNEGMGEGGEVGRTGDEDDGFGGGHGGLGCFILF